MRICLNLGTCKDVETELCSRAKGFEMKAYWIVACLVVLTLTLVWFAPACFAVNRDEASANIGEAERDLSLASSVVAEAEKAGANVSAYLARFDDAGKLLSEAYAAFGRGDYDNASFYAIQCADAVDGVVENATRLKMEAEAAYRNSMFLAAGTSSFYLSLLFVLSLFGWRFLKNRYFKRVLGMKPEVVTDE